MILKKKLSLPGIAILIITVVCLLIDFNFKNWKKQERVIQDDVVSSYAYLPAKFIYHDIKLEKSDYRFSENYSFFLPLTTTDGKKVIKNTMGLSIMYSPFFFVAHIYAVYTDYPENGFSEPYKLFLLLSTIFYLIIGLDFLRKILQHYAFSDVQIALTILLTGLGTNLLCYASQSAPMEHVYSFCLFAIFIYYTIKWHHYNSMKNTIILGLLLGLITLISTSNAIIILFFFLYGVSTYAGFRERMRLFRKEAFLLNVIVFVAFLIWIPQLIYWKEVTGNYFFSAATDEGFFFSHPRIIDGLFSFRKGWLLYTPMMGFALIGLFFLKDLKKTRLSVIVFLIANIYILFSWWCWWYGPSFGQPYFVDSYALMAIPFAAFIKYSTEKKWFIQSLFYVLALFFTGLNIFQTIQFEHQSIHPEGMTSQLYAKQFGKLHKIAGFNLLVNNPDYDKAKSGSINIDGPDNKDLLLNTFTGKVEQRHITIHLLASSNKYACTDEGVHNLVVANREKASTWETFTLIYFDKNECAIRAFNTDFLSAELSGKAEITANRKSIGAWETFTIVNLENGQVAFKAYNNKFLTWDDQSLQLFATADSIGDKEKFKLEAVK